MMEAISKGRWKVALVVSVGAVVAAHLVPAVLPVVGGVWVLTLLFTLLAALWTARGSESGRGRMLGLLVGGIVVAANLIFFWPVGLGTLLMVAMTLAAGWLGGRLGSRL
jgi:hypothetical protein